MTTGAAAVGPTSRDVDDTLERIFERDYHRFVNVARALLDRTGEAEEVVQEAFARSCLAWRKSGVPVAPERYVRAAVVNLARNGLRRRILGRGLRADAAPGPATPEQVAVDDDDVRILHGRVRALPARQRECVVLRHVLETSVEETADLLGISPGSVKTHTHRGVAALRETMEDT